VAADFLPTGDQARHDVVVELCAFVPSECLAAMAACWENGRMISSKPSHRPTACCAWAKPAAQRWRGSKIKEPQLAAAIDARSVPVDRSGRIERRLRRKVVFWSLAATGSLLLVAVVGVPLIAAKLTPLVPYALERKLGAAVDAQARATLDSGHAGAAFECGNSEKERAGRAAFDKLMGQLETAAELPLPLKVTVVRRPESNAITLPGGHIYVFEGLIDKARTPDELAGVVAHEVGHGPRRTNGAGGHRSVAAVRNAVWRFRRRRCGGSCGEAVLQRVIPARSRPQPMDMV
jgi:hypothetical protein